MPPLPKFVQICGDAIAGLYALDSNGNVWKFEGSAWIPLPMTIKE